MSAPEERLLAAIFPERYGSRLERLLARWERRLTNLADWGARIPLDSEAVPTGIWRAPSWVGGWCGELRIRLMQRRHRSAG